uniref:Nuclear fragile X mental retardation-interacting protein 2 n=1 Tax=Gadus morhua TaxID=8049 RepID=A0A8C5CTZ1_GADMO
MEEQPRDRPPERHYPRHQHPHAEDRPSAADLNGVKHEQIHLQHQETQAKKTGSRRLTGGSEHDAAEKTSACPAGMSHPPGSHGNRHVINSTLKQTHPGSASSTLTSASASAGPPRAAGRNNAAAELRRQQSSDQLRPGKDKEAAPVPNGLPGGPLTNGYSSGGRPATDGPGEGGYSSQKRLRARGGAAAMVRNAENVIREAEREPRGPPSPDALDKGLSSRLEGPPRAAPRGEGPGATVVDPQRKNGEGKGVAVFGKKPDEKHKGGGGKHLSPPSKEDSWTLFKPPPVFPVDNSSAKIVPKISYASKVKENLNKEAAAAAAAAVAPPPAPVRLSQVPMSAMKTISSVSFTNGPLPGNGHPLGGTYFAPGAAQASCLPPGEAGAAAGPGGDGDAFELKKCALLIYPLNMQPVLPSARPHDPQAPPTNQKALGEIFQNQWGLSFINEPGLGPEGGDKAAAAAAGPPAPEPVTFAPDSRRTCVPHGRSATFGPLTAEREDEDKPGVRGPDKARLEPRGPTGGGGGAQAREGGAKTGPSSLPTLTFGSSKDRSPPGGLDRRASWGAFDVRAAVTYHTKEIEYIFNLQKQGKATCYLQVFFSCESFKII